MYEVYSRSHKLFCCNTELEPRLVVIRLQSTVNPKKNGSSLAHLSVARVHVGSLLVSRRDMVICKYWFKMLITELLPVLFKQTHLFV